MGEATSKRFEPKDGEAPLRIEKVELHRAFETDRDGRAWVHVWISAEATPIDEAFQSITADIVFALSGNGDALGSCARHAVAFDKAETVAITADDDLRIDAHADVTEIAVKIDLVKVVHETGERSFLLS